MSDHPRKRPLFAAGAFLLAVLVALLTAAFLHGDSAPAPRGMTAATVVSTASRADGLLEVTVTYDVSGRHTLRGQVNGAQFAQDGAVVWVCYVPKAPGDTARARLRLPSDELCGQR